MIIIMRLERLKELPTCLSRAVFLIRGFMVAKTSGLYYLNSGDDAKKTVKLGHLNGKL